MKTCATCEYFDSHNGDCLHNASPRFQTEAAREACGVYYCGHCCLNHDTNPPKCDDCGVVVEFT